jgi:hypothetical protein
MINPTAYVALFTFFLANGESLETEEDVYPSYEECMLESEAQAKSMDRQWQWEERKTGQSRFFKGVEVRCEKRTRD